LTGLDGEAKRNNSTLLIGLPYAEEEDRSRYYNSMVAVGLSQGMYHKRHLVPFGEFLPLKFMLGDLLHFLRIPMANFSRGAERQAPIDINGARVSISICYEDVFGEEIIRDFPEANFLVNVSNDAWFGDSFSPHQHLQMARMRTMETARPMLRATNNGVSAIIDYTGKVLARSPQFEANVLNGSIQPRSGATPYVLFGNIPVLTMIVLSLGLAGFKLRSSKHAE
jgi:apolipoprotein N-acyltransferase